MTQVLRIDNSGTTLPILCNLNFSEFKKKKLFFFNLREYKKKLDKRENLIIIFEYFNYF
jgi:hypothetical protein